MVETETDHRASLGPVRDQGERPTCLSHATSTVHTWDRSLDNPLSAAALHYHATGADWSRGSTIGELQDALEHEGHPESRHCPPLQPGQLAAWSPPENVQVYRSPSETDVGLGSVAIEAVHDDQLPVLVVSLPDEFYRPQPPWVLTAGDVRGGYHAVTGIGVGTHEDEPTLLIRNSWGKSWADGGHAWLDPSFLDEHLEVVLLLDRGAHG